MTRQPGRTSGPASLHNRTVEIRGVQWPDVVSETPRGGICLAVSGPVYGPLDGLNRTCERRFRPESLEGRGHAAGHLPSALFLVLTLFIFLVAILIIEIIVFQVVIIVLKTEGRRGKITHTYVSPSGCV